tara:strand:- start:1186 stop:1590 length:405 start_codon:yes stop_codon:yes gene_type:complete
MPDSQRKCKPGQKMCPECDCINGVRAFICKQCNYEFKMKKRRRGVRKILVKDYNMLNKGDKIRVVGGSGPFHTDNNGERTYLVDRGKYTVDKIDNLGIHAYGNTGYNYLYMGKRCPSDLLQSITRAPCKIFLMR